MLFIESYYVDQRNGLDYVIFKLDSKVVVENFINPIDDISYFALFWEIVSILYLNSIQIRWLNFPWSGLGQLHQWHVLILFIGCLIVLLKQSNIYIKVRLFLLGQFISGIILWIQFPSYFILHIYLNKSNLIFILFYFCINISTNSSN